MYGLYTCCLQVLWQLETGAMSYLPRLGGAITSIAACPTDAAKYVLSQADNTVRVVSALVSLLFCGIGLSVLFGQHCPCTDRMVTETAQRGLRVLL